jgi:hypothetical protein
MELNIFKLKRDAWFTQRRIVNTLYLLLKRVKYTGSFPHFDHKNQRVLYVSGVQEISIHKTIV